MEKKDSIIEVIEKRKKEIGEIDENLILETTSVSMALDSLKKALDKVSIHLNNREIEKASSCGYNEVASEFVYVQRALAGLKAVEHKKESFISEIALQTMTSYEKVAPYVEGKLEFFTKKETEDDTLYGKVADLAIKEGECFPKRNRGLTG